MMLELTSMASAVTAEAECRFELRFAAASEGGQDYVFPCDATGHVDLDALPEKVRIEYFFARAVMGRDVAWPVVAPARSL